MQASSISTASYAKVIANSKRVRWDIESDVLRGRRFDLSKPFLPSGLSLAGELPFLGDADRRLFSQVQGRSYAYIFGLVERFIGAKVLDLSRAHSLGDQVALEALVRMTDEEIKHQELFRRLEALMEADMPAGYRPAADPNAVAAAVLEKSTWAVLALTLHIELFTQAHYRASIAAEADICELWRDVFLFHWKEESQHAVLDELEFLSADARLTPAERDLAVGELIELVGAVDQILAGPGGCRCGLFPRRCARRFLGGPARDGRGDLPQGLPLAVHRFGRHAAALPEGAVRNDEPRSGGARERRARAAAVGRSGRALARGRAGLTEAGHALRPPCPSRLQAVWRSRRPRPRPARPWRLRPTAPPAVASAAVAAQDGSGSTSYEGVVEALRQTIVAAQVPGAVVALQVRAGDKVHAGQVLMRIDARAADQTAAAGAAQARAARAALEAATREFERQQQLFAQGFISQAALDRADAHFKTAQAEASAHLANAGAARTQSDFYVVKAPYGGVVANVSVVLGDMAMPGRPLLTLYDPAALRVTAAIPQTAVARSGGALAPQAEIPGAAAGLVKPVHVQLLPTVDVASQTLELRLDLPPDTNAAPGMFARAWLSGPGTGAARETPGSSCLRRRWCAARSSRPSM